MAKWKRDGDQWVATIAKLEWRITEWMGTYGSQFIVASKPATRSASLTTLAKAKLFAAGELDIANL